MRELELKVKGEYSESGMEPWETLLTSIDNDLSIAGHFNARNVGEAGQLLRLHEHKEARLIAGGTDILRLIKRRYVPSLPEVLVNIKTIPGLSYIREESGILKIGALATLSQIENSDVVETKCSILAETAGVVGSPQVRNMATVAGSLCQDVTCWYYRAEKDFYHCRRKGGTTCPAISGDNRWMFGVFGAPEGCGCYATCQSDIAIALSALGASIRTTQRLIPLDSFYVPTPPWNILTNNEVITEIQIPLLANLKAKYTKFSIRKSLDHPLVSVACVANDKEVRLAIGGVSLVPYLAHRVSDMLSGRVLTAHLAEKAGDVAAEDAAPLSMNAWKVEVMKVLVKRTLLGLI